MQAFVSTEIDSDDSWKSQLQRALQSAEDLSRMGLIPESEKAAYERVLSKYSFRLPRYYADLIDKNDPNCPIRRQSIPDLRELDSKEGYVPDPLSDLSHQPAHRITHRYKDRVLLHLTASCSMICRYCFRKTLLDESKREFLAGRVEEALAYLREHPEIQEVIFSGGDPLMVSDAQLKQVLNRVCDISSIKRIRFHTRVPVTLPMRVTPSLVSALSDCRLPVIVVSHFNHPKEITPQSRLACERLGHKGIFVLNQSVLLKGVNDSAEVLRTLSEALFEMKVIPYYLHHPDPAEGTAHFDVPVKEGKAIYHDLRSQLSGYLVPKYVVDVVGSPFKRSLFEV